MNDVVFMLNALKGRILIYAFIIIAGFLFSGLLAARNFVPSASTWIYIAIGVLLLLVLVVIVVAYKFRKKLWLPKDAESAEEEEAKTAMSRAIDRQAKEARKRAKKLDSRSIKVPWNIFLTLSPSENSSIMSELGYSLLDSSVSFKGTSVSTWVSQTAVAYRIDTEAGHEPSLDVIGALSKTLRSQRPTIPFNAFFIEMNLAHLADLEYKERDRVSSVNLILNRMVEECQIDAPIHIGLTGLEQNKDLVRAAILTESISEKRVLGGFLKNATEDPVKSTHDLFSDMICRLERMQVGSLSKQLSSDFCTSLVNAPLQLQVISTQIQPILKQVLSPLPPRQEHLLLSSIAFVGTANDTQSADLLGRFNSQKFFNSETLIGVDKPEGRVTSRHASALATSYHKEAFAVAPNRNRTVQQAARGMVEVAVFFGVIVIFTTGVILNLHSYNLVNKDMEARFVQYYQDIAFAELESDALTSRIFALQKLREGIDQYNDLPYDIIPRWFPKGSLEKNYTHFYHQELVEGYQRSLADYMERDLFAFNELEDEVTLFSLALLDLKFYGDQEVNKTEIAGYFIRSFADEGHISPEFTIALQGTLDDLFALNTPLKLRNKELNEVVLRSISSLNVADMLYQLLLRKAVTDPPVVDLVQRLGPRFEQIFEDLPNSETYNLPTAFTRKGFNTIYLDGDMPTLNEYIEDYELLVGELKAEEKNSLVRRVGELYTNDYISHWTNFVSSLTLRKPSNWEEAHILVKALSDETANPVSMLLVEIREATHIPDTLETTGAGDEKAGDDEVSEQKTDKIEALSEQKKFKNSQQSQSARKIRAAFSDYLSTTEVDGQNLTQFDILLQYTTEVKLWMDAAVSAPNGPEEFIFDQYKSASTGTPLAILNDFAQRSRIQIINNYGTSLSAKLDSSAMAFVKSHINDQWRKLIYRPYSDALSTTFPFVLTSPVDLSLLDFTALFGPESAMANFRTLYLEKFEEKDGRLSEKSTFLSRGKIGPSSDAIEMFGYAREITVGMFTDGKANINFRLRVGYMGAELSRAVIKSGITILNYAHGPVLWTDQTWPMVGLQDSDMELSVYKRSYPMLEKSFSGAWSWFRLAQFGSSSLNPSLGISETKISAGENIVSLQFDAPAKFSPFDPAFFKRFQLRESLF